MRRSELFFKRPTDLVATAPTEIRGKARDRGRLLVSANGGHQHARFLDLPQFLQPGDLLVVNRSATLPASLPGEGSFGKFILNLSTDYGSGLWLAEPRFNEATPGPLPVRIGDRIMFGEICGHFIAPYPGIERLWFVQFSGSVTQAMSSVGRPIRYGYLAGNYDLTHYQTLFAKVPGSAEMPSAAYPFTRRVLQRLHMRGIEIADVTLHTGVSSLEVEEDKVEQHPLYPEPFWVPSATAAAVNKARAANRRVIALGTTVVRALESAWNGEAVHHSSGFTRLFVHPARGVCVVNGLITGLHDPNTSHLAMLYALAGQSLIRSAYEEAVQHSYLWHEFGDSHLILPDTSAKIAPASRSAAYGGIHLHAPTHMAPHVV